MGMIRPVPLETQQQVLIYERKLRKEALPYSVFEQMGDVYSTTKRVPMPEAIYLRLQPGYQIAPVVQFPMIKSLSGLPAEGNAVAQVGTEQRRVTKYGTARANDVFCSVACEEYGIDANTKEPYEINEQAVEAMATWDKELLDMYRHQGLLERMSQNLQSPPHNLAPMLTPNIYVAGLSDAAQPVYNSLVAATWANTVGTALVAAGTAATACATRNYYLRLDYWASTIKFIEPIMIGGKETYICLIPSNQALYLKSPAGAGSMTNPIQTLSDNTLTEQEMNFRNVLGRIGRCLLIEDMRWPTITLGGSAGNYSLTTAYRRMGRNGVISDPRDMTINGRDAGFLLGKGSLIERKDTDWHIEYHWEDYDKFYGVGNQSVVGINMPIYNLGTPTVANEQQDSSIACIFAKPPANFI